MKLAQLLGQIEDKIHELKEKKRHGKILIEVNLTPQGGIGESYIQDPKEELHKRIKQYGHR